LSRLDKASTFAIIGAGQSGAWIARTLRTEGFDGRVVLVGDEPHRPYERPPLSKGALDPQIPETENTLLNQQQAEAKCIEMWLGTAVTALSPTTNRFECADGRSLVYDHLFLTTGSRARSPSWLPKGPSHRVHFLRTLDDAARLRAALATSSTLIIVGGGWIGLEVAASARKQGIAVTILEAAERVCARSVPAPVSAWLTELHRKNGVSVVLNAAILRAEEACDGVVLSLADGTTVVADQLLVAIGNVPETSLAIDGGLAVTNGIVVDAAGRTSIPNISAAGDVASQPCGLTGARVRRESWSNAQNQAIATARAALGQQVVYDEVPWNWSDQFNLNIQIVGVPERGKNLFARAGRSMESPCWLALDDCAVPIGAIGIDAARDVRHARKLIQKKQPIRHQDWMSEKQGF